MISSGVEMGSIKLPETSSEAKFDWQEAIKAKQKDLAGRVPRDWLLDHEFVERLSSTHLNELDIPARSSILSEKETEITQQYSAQDLLNKLRDRTLTSVEVTTAFCKRACIAQQLVSPSLDSPIDLLTFPAFVFDRSFL